MSLFNIVSTNLVYTSSNLGYTWRFSHPNSALAKLMLLERCFVLPLEKIHLKMPFVVESIQQSGPQGGPYTKCIHVRAVLWKPHHVVTGINQVKN